MPLRDAPVSRIHSPPPWRIVPDPQALEAPVHSHSHSLRQGGVPSRPLLLGIGCSWRYWNWPSTNGPGHQSAVSYWPASAPAAGGIPAATWETSKATASG